MKSLNVLVTSGGTISEIDNVRHIGNFSKGSTGAAIAEEFLLQGNSVHYIKGFEARLPFVSKLTINPDHDFEQEVIKARNLYETYSQVRENLFVHDGGTFDQYFHAVKRILTEEKIDVAVLVAAVSDYSAQKVEGKISSTLDELNLVLKRNEKVISHIKEWSPEVYQIGFKLLAGVSDNELIRVAYHHLHLNHSDLVVANSFGIDGVSTYLVTPDGSAEPVRRYELAKKLVDHVTRFAGVPRTTSIL